MSKKSKRRKINGKTKTDLPEQTMQGTMCEVKTICGLHSIFYPGALALMALHSRRYAVFHTTCECGTGYVYACQDDGCHVRKGGHPMAIIEVYEAIPWKESVLRDENGIFYFKVAPSLEELKKYFENN